MTYSDTYVGKLVLTLRAAEDERDGLRTKHEHAVKLAGGLLQSQHALEVELLLTKQERDAALARCERLQAALRPFARQTELNEDLDRDELVVAASDCRRAREALEQP